MTSVGHHPHQVAAPPPTPTVSWDDLVASLPSSDTVVIRYPRCWPKTSYPSDLLLHTLFVVRLGTGEVDIVTDLPIDDESAPPATPMSPTSSTLTPKEVLEAKPQAYLRAMQAWEKSVSMDQLNSMPGSGPLCNRPLCASTALMMLIHSGSITEKRLTPQTTRWCYWTNALRLALKEPAEVRMSVRRALEAFQRPADTSAADARSAPPGSVHNDADDAVAARYRVAKRLQLAFKLNPRHVGLREYINQVERGQGGQGGVVNSALV